MSPEQLAVALRIADSPVRVAIARALRNAFFEQEITDMSWQHLQTTYLVTLINFEVSLAALGLKIVPAVSSEPPITSK